ncbi:hypothetical protein OS493_024120 [Desmophyllum pertusum]|uniref:Uncharacterized protein n=1 Tax=Desmophyllum pertusum TaxID=174260 RepID=A0A9W9ZB85_9CNID|nr:hypothetical protein OS493_024120 [Desmophyllum pertusum]
MQGGKVSQRQVLSFSEFNWRELLKWAVPGLLYFCDNLIGFYILLTSVCGSVHTDAEFRHHINCSSIQNYPQEKVEHSPVGFLADLILVNRFTLQRKERTSASSTSTNPPRHRTNRRSGVDPTRTRLGRLSESTTDFGLAECHRREENLGVFRVSEGHVLVMIQCVLSSSANIYNEKIFKEGQGMEDSILLQKHKIVHVRSFIQKP